MHAYVHLDNIGLYSKCHYQTSTYDQKALARSIKKWQMITPLTVILDNEHPNNHLVVDGFQRYHALLNLQVELPSDAGLISHVPVYVMPYAPDKIPQLRTITKLFQNPPKPFLLGSALKDLVHTQGTSQSEMAKDLDISQERMSSLIALTQKGMVPHLLNLAEKGLLSEPLIRRLARLPVEQQTRFAWSLEEPLNPQPELPETEESTTPNRPSFAEVREKYNDYCNIDLQDSGMTDEQKSHLSGILKGLHFALGKEVTNWSAINPNEWGLAQEAIQQAERLDGALYEAGMDTMRVLSKILIYRQDEDDLSPDERVLLQDLRNKVSHE